MKARNWSRFLLRLWVVGSTLWLCLSGLVVSHKWETAKRLGVAKVDACREKALAEDRPEHEERFVGYPDLARFMASQNALRTHPQSAACESLANDLAREQREVFASDAAGSLVAPLLALVLFFAAQWIIQGL